MQRTWWRPACVALVGAVMIAGNLIASPHAWAGQTIQATTTVNVRSGPSTSRAIIGYVAWGWTIESTGPSVDGWTPVDYKGRPGYVSSQYFTTPGAPAAVADGPKGESWTTAALNVRNGPSTSHSRIDTLPLGAKVTLTGVTSNGFAQIVWYGGARAWVATSWLSPTPTTPTAPPADGSDPGAEPENPGPNVPSDPNPPSNPDPTTPVPPDPPASPEPTTPAEPDPTTPAEPEPTTPAEPDPTTPAEPDPTTPAEPDPTTPAEPDPTTPAEPDPTDPPEEDLEPILPDPPALPAVVGQKRATADLNLRDRASIDGAIIAVIPNGSTLDVTGAEENGRTEVVWQNRAGWVASEFVAELGSTGPTPEPPPAVSGVRYATTTLNVRSGPSLTSAVVGLLTAGQEVTLTGQISDNWYEIHYNGAARWVSGDYLTDTKPKFDESGGSVGLNELKWTAQEIVARSQQVFPQIRTYYGKAYRNGTSDHDVGRAVDIMLPDYRNNKPLGDQISAYFQAHAAEFDIDYIIWNQHIWEPDLAWQGWVWMADRGSDTENHKDHVHISVNP